MRWVIPFLIVASLSVPAASAWSADLLLRMDAPSKFVLEAQASIDGQEASDLRMQIDEYGDGDSNVESDEVEMLEDLIKSMMNNVDEEDADSSIGAGITVDGKNPNGFTFKEFDIRDAEGKTSSTSALSAMIKAEITYDVQAGDNHTIRLSGTDDSGDEESGASDFLQDLQSAKMRAPSGYVFSSTQGLPEGAKVSGDKKEIEFADALGPASGETVIVMTKGGGGGSSPGPALAVFALVLVGAMWAARKRLEDR